MRLKESTKYWPLIFYLSILFSLLVSCSSSEKVNLQELKRYNQEDLPDINIITSNDSSILHFENPDYYIRDDTLYTRKKYILNDSLRYLKRKIPFTDIASVEYDHLNYMEFILLVLVLTVIAGSYFLIL